MKRYIILTMLVFSTTMVFSQLATNRMRAHYRLTPERLAKIESMGFHLTSAIIGVRYTVDGFDKPFKFLATLKDGAIKLDPWSLTDSSFNQNRRDSVVAPGDTVRWITATTPADMEIGLKRSSMIQRTQVVRLPYRTWLLTVNTIAIKVRPSATDSAGKNYSANVGSSFNLGLSLGYTFGTTAFTHRTQISRSHTVGLGLGFSAVALSKEPLKTPINVSATPSNFVLSPNVSYTFARNDIGIVVAAGIDTMTGSHADSWLYQNRFFWGFGLAVGLKV
ncbi:MAG: hypothetical protein ACOH13_13135 [Flavobacteriales bacterium]